MKHAACCSNTVATIVEQREAGMTELLIDGEWVSAQGGIHELFDPAHQRLMEPIQCAGHAQRQRAVAAAQGALGSWAQRPLDERVAFVAAIVDEIRQVAGALAERQAIESGQPLRECQDLVANAIRRLRSRAAHSHEVPQAQIRRLPRHRLWPFWEHALKAIEAGSALVCELPADRALTALAVAHCAQRLPPGVLNVITVEMEAELSPPTDAATEFVFVGQDADVDVAVAGAAALRLYNTGQRMGQSTRIHVEAPLAYRFADRLHEYLAFLEAGDPRKPLTDLGPLQSQAALQRAIEQIGIALRQGALVKLGGRPYQPWGLTGYFLQPTLLIEGSGVERALYESIAGPVVIVAPTTDIGVSLRQSVGVTHQLLRLSAFTRQVQKFERSLRSARFVPCAGPYTVLVERAWKPQFTAERTNETVHIEFIEGPQVDWFPYKNRRGLTL
jgi:acyl-CoA reductase-like NAD-dependent aldehyde dehydrogenase